MRVLAPGRAGNTRAPSRSPRGTSWLHGPRWAGTAQLQPPWSLGVAGEAMLETPRMGQRAFKSCAAGTRAQSACVVPPNVSAQLCLQEPSAALHGLSLQDPKLRLVELPDPKSNSVSGPGRLVHLEQISPERECQHMSGSRKKKSQELLGILN